MRDVKALAGLFTASGVLHLVRPSVFEAIVPRWVPARREVVLASGLAELGCAVGLLHPRSRPTAGWASLALLLAVYPANVQMALDASRSGSAGRQAVALGRLPLQLPLLWAAHRATRRPRRSRPADIGVPGAGRPG